MQLETAQPCFLFYKWKHNHDKLCFELSFFSSKAWCFPLHLKKNNLCYSFVWHEFTTDTKHKAPVGSVAVLGFEQITSEMQFLFEASSATIQPIILLPATESIVTSLLTYCIMFKSLVFKIKSVGNGNIRGFFVQSHKYLLRVTIFHLFECHKNTFISKQYVCDGIEDCPGTGFDEINCVCKQNISKTHKCKIFKFVQNTSPCSLLYNATIDRRCVPFSRGKFEKVMERAANFRVPCKNGKQIDKEFVNDIVVDCYPDADDEPILHILLQHEGWYKCNIPEKLPCKEGHPRCFNISDICKYEMNFFNILIPCRTGGHIEECKYFECSVLFKCPHSYCIPWRYLCVGKWDCTFGADEALAFECSTRICGNLFKCRTQNICVHLGNVCDGIQDCPLGDDESFCLVKNFRCPTRCFCLALAIQCINTTLTWERIPPCPPHLAVSFLFSPDGWTFDVVAIFQQASVLHFIGNNITSICNVSSTWLDIKIFDFGFNHISQITRHCFYNLTDLQTINLSENQVSTIQSESFSFLPKLKVVNLSSNVLLHLPENVLFKVSNLDTFLILGNRLEKIDKDTFGETVLKSVQASVFQMCCIVSANTICASPEIPWHVSCSTLLPTVPIRVTLLALSIMLFVVNILCPSVHIKKFIESKSMCILVFAINANDVNCFMYLTILLAADLYFGAGYIGSDVYLRSSGTCFTMFGFALSFSLTSPLLLFTLALARFVVVIAPLKNKFFKRWKYTLKVIIYIWVPVFVFSVVWTLVAKFVHKTLPVSLCLPFVDPTDSLFLFKVTTWTTSLSQLISTLSISGVYVQMIRSLSSHKKSLNLSVRKSNTPVIVQVVVVTLSNILCWIPSSVIFLTSLFLSQYPTQLIVWTTITFVPLNSFINPLVFTVTTLKKSKQGTRKFSSQTTSDKRPEISTLTVHTSVQIC